MAGSPERFFRFNTRSADRSNLENLLLAHRIMQDQLGRKLPPYYPLSLWMATYLVSGGLTLTVDLERPAVREELILPNDPGKEASYWLGFRPYNSDRLQDALLVRITDRPQCFLGIAEHPKIDEIVQELREVYDSKTIDRRTVILGIPTSDFAFRWSGPLQNRVFNVVYPKEGMGTSIAADFERVLNRHSAVEELLKKGSKYLSDRVEEDRTAIISLS